MFVCELCKKEFDTIRKLSIHISHPNSSCKPNKKTRSKQKKLTQDKNGSPIV